MLKIGLFKLGYVGDVDLNKVARLFNVSPGTIRVVVCDPIPNIGEPDTYGMAYSDERLFDLFPPGGENAIRAGVIRSPIQDNFFTRTKDLNSIVLSLFQTDELCEKAGRTKEEYIALTLAMEVLSFQFQSRTPGSHYTDIMHQDTRGCLFDFVAHKPDEVHKLRTAQIDSICRGKLVAANVPESILATVEQVLQRIRRPTFMGSLIVGLQNPLFSFVFGGVCFGLVINASTSLALGELDSAGDYYVLGGLLLLVIILAVGNYIRVLLKNKGARPY